MQVRRIRQKKGNNNIILYLILKGSIILLLCYFINEYFGIDLATSFTVFLGVKRRQAVSAF